MPKQDIIDTNLGKVGAIESAANDVFSTSIDDFSRQVTSIAGEINPATLKAELKVALRQSGYYQGTEAYISQAYQGIIDVSGETYKQLYGKGFKLTDESLQNLGNLQSIDAQNFQALADNTINELNKQILTSTVTPISQAALNESLERTLKQFKDYVETNITTSTAGVYRDANTLLAQDNGIDKFEYVGVMDSITRQFCRIHMGEVKTMEEWAKEKNGQKLPVPLYMGGYNCRHTFKGVIDDFEGE